LLRICFRIARDIGCTVAELGLRLSWAELLHWIALYQIEADLALPPDKRPVRPKSPEETAKALNQALGLGPKKTKKTI
jgi:DNA mismatch repair protein MutH